MPTKSQQKKYVCSHCGKPFSRSEHKARHERSHTGVKPFECKVCRHAFVRRDLLQRHIRTVHRELLVEGSMEVPEGAKEPVRSDLVLELLVNSMIKVSGEERSGERGRSLVYVPDKSPRCRRKRKEEPPVGAGAGLLSEESVHAVCEMTKDAFSAESVRRLYARGAGHLVERNVFVHSVAGHAAGAGALLPATLVCLGAYLECAEDVASDVWHVCWNRCLQESSLVAMNLLVHALLLFSRHHHTEAGIRHVFASYQQVLLEHVKRDSDQFVYDETWLIFHIWVSLLRALNEPNPLSCSLYEWFLQQPVLSGCNLKDLVFQVVLDNNKWHVTSLNLVADALYCDWIIGRTDSFQFKDSQEFRNAIMMLSKKFAQESVLQDDVLQQLNLIDLPSKFSSSLAQNLISVQSESHWLLLETTWFNLIRAFNVRQDNERWFMDSMAEFPTIFIDSSMINDSFIKCCLPIFPLIESANNINARYVSLISDVTIFLIRLFEFEMSVSNNKYCPHRLIGLMKNPMIQLLIFVGYRLTGRRGYPQQENIAIEHFINRYVVNCNEVIDEYTQEELTHNLFDSQSIAYVGFHELVQSFVTYLKETVITERLMRVPHLNHDIKLHLFDFSQRHYHYHHHSYQAHEPQAVRRLTEAYHSPQQPLWMYSPQSSRSMSIDSSMNDRQSMTSVGMSNSTSMEASMFGDPNIMLPRLNIATVRRSSNDTAAPKVPQQYPSYYMYGPAETMTNQRNSFSNTGKPVFNNPKFSNMDGVLMDNSQNVATSPRSSANSTVKLPPPSELFGVSSK